MIDYIGEKRELLNKVINNLTNELMVLKKASEDARRASINAPSKMESRYDSMKFEQDMLSRNFSLKADELKEGIGKLKKFNPSVFEKVSLGSLVEIENVGESGAEFYFILDFGSGIVIETDNFKNVRVLSPDSPIGQILMDKKHRDMCKINTPNGDVREFVIKSIY